ncbi:hypothetical protein [Microcoleus sp. D3_18a_C4]|uniref:hypothetical protein n=1 Tax=Microcoleus sp. D3_18a_C4 TaxID=3055332 RepID=UPI002FD074B5
MPVPQENSLFVEQAEKPVHKKLIENGATFQLKPTAQFEDLGKSKKIPLTLYYFLGEYREPIHFYFYQYRKFGQERSSISGNREFVQVLQKW